MVVATHRIEIEAKTNNDWSEKELQKYCIKKLYGVDDIWYTRLESINIDQKTVKAHVLIHSVYYDFIKYREEIEDFVKTWIKDHINESWLMISKIDIKPLGRSIKQIGGSKQCIYL